MKSVTQNLSGDWKIHTPNLLGEILENKGTSILTRPLQIFASKLTAIAARAIELQDKELLKLCCDLTLLEESDPKSENYDPELVKSLSIK